MNIVVTGGTGGLGRAIVKALSARDTDIIFAGRDSDAIATLESELAGESVAGLSCDLTRPDSVERFAEQVQQRFDGVLDLLVNNAGVARYGACDHITAIDFDTVFDTNVRGPMLLTSRLLPLLRKSPQAQIINISSVLGTQGIPNAALYTASKHAIEGFSKVLRLEEAPGIRVTVIQPGAIDTGITRYVPPGGKSTPSSERLTSEEVAGWVSSVARSPANMRTDIIRLTPGGQLL